MIHWWLAPILVLAGVFIGYLLADIAHVHARTSAHEIDLSRAAARGELSKEAPK